MKQESLIAIVVGLFQRRYILERDLRKKVKLVDS